MIEREDIRQVTPEEQRQDQLRATQLGCGAGAGALAVTTVLREVHSTRDTGAVMRAEILTDILAPPVRGTILMRPDTTTVTTRTERDRHRGTVMIHTGTVTTRTETDRHRGTVVIHTGTVTTRTETDRHRGREGIDTRTHLHHIWSISDFLYCSFFSTLDRQHLKMTFKVNLV